MNISNSNEMNKNSKLLSIVVPVFNEETSIENLFKTIKETLDNRNVPFEVIFVDDGSTDRSWPIVERLSDVYEEVKGVQLSRNVGQHNAIYAGFKEAEGDYVVTIDADMQDSPSVIPEIFARLQSGFDIVGCKRKVRKDNPFRRFLSSLMHFTIRHFSKLGGITTEELPDFGCMLRGYRKWVVEKIVELSSKSVYIPTFASLIGGKFCEVEVEHKKRKKGRSKYNIKKLFGLYFDLITDISLFPIQLISILGIFLSFVGFALGLIIFVRRIVIGPEVEGVFTLFAFLFIFFGVLLISVGLIGEYVGRIYREVNKSPRYVIVKKTGSSRRKLRIGVFAYSEVGYTCLKKLVDMKEEVIFVVTHRDNPDEIVWFRSVEELANQYYIPVLKPESISDKQFINVIASFKPDVIFSFYYRKIFPEKLLSVPRKGCINLHGSYLPAYRGRAPINWAIINGEKETGITFHYMTEEVDAGPIITQERIAIADNDTGLTLTKKVASYGAKLLEGIVKELHQYNKLQSKPQDESKASYFPKRTPDMGKIEWKWKGEKIQNYVRALAYPFPGAFFMLKGKRCIIRKGSIQTCNSTDLPGTIVFLSRESIVIKTADGCFSIKEVGIDNKVYSVAELGKIFHLTVGRTIGN